MGFGSLRNFGLDFITGAGELFRSPTRRHLWPPLLFELLLAASMCVAYFFLVQKYAMGVTNDNTNYWVFSSCSLSNFHLEQIYDVWKGRLSGLLFSGVMFDFLVKDNSVNLEKYGNAFALYQSLWLFLLFMVITMALRRSLLVNLGIFAGLIYNFSPAAGFYFYPWDIPATLFFTLGVLFFERRQIRLMVASTIIGCFFKETVLVTALLLFFVDDWKWWKRILTFVGIGAVYAVGKKILVAHLHLKVAALSMGDAKDLHALLNPRILIENVKFICTPTFNHVIFANAGTMVAVLILGWQRRFLPYTLVILVFLAGQFMYGAFNEFRIFMQILPLSLIILAERWPESSGPEAESSTRPDSQTTSKERHKSVTPTIFAPPWSVRKTFPILTLLAIFIGGVSVALPAWRYYAIIEFQKPDHQAREVALLTSKAEGGDVQAQFQLAKHYLTGQGVAVNPTNAFLWFTRSAEQGVSEAQCQLGVCYVQGIGTAKDFAASIPWFRKAAALGNVDSQYNLGLLYENGLGVKQDLAEAAIWYQRAGEKGHILAQNNLGLICFNLRKDYAEAAQWFRKAADQGNALAQNSLGVLYLQGLGVKQDADEALKWFKKSAQLGLAEGQNNCGLVYFSAQRYNESVQWFHKAADQNHVGAQYNLAQFYQKGLACSQDLGEANLWYARAAKQGYGLAQLALGEIYYEGQGVKEDDVEAYKWFKLAQSKGEMDAEKALTNCAARMSKEQVNTAEEEAKQFQKQ